MLQEGEYAAFLKHVRGMKEVMEESIPRLRRLQQMVVELPTAYGLPCDEEAPETLRLDEEAVARYHELSDELIERKYHFYEEMTSVMDGCEGLVDFSEDRRELEKLLDEIQQMKTYKRMLDEYADEMRRMDNWMVERLSEYVKIGDSGNMIGKGIAFTECQPEIETISSIPGQDEVLDSFDSYGIEKQIAIRLLDTELYNNLGIVDIAERQRLIQSIMDNKPYVFDNLYILNAKSGVDYQRQMSYVLFDIKFANYINMVEKVGDWYISNVHTYCSLNQEDYNDVVEQQRQLQEMGINRGDPEWISTTARGRQGYSCSLNGNLYNLTVYDDCSSYVTACLIQSGFLDEDTQQYNSYDYIGGEYIRNGVVQTEGDAAQALRDAGFVWHPVSEMTEEEKMNLQQGDIMVRQGHVQIFDGFKTEENNPIIIAYSWGSINYIEPVETCRLDTFSDSYEGIWRLEN